MPWPYLLTAEQQAPTAPGAVAFATKDPSAPGVIWLSTVDANSTDRSADYATLVEGDLVRLTAAGDASIWSEFLCREAPTVTGGVVAIADPIHMAEGTPGKVLGVPSPITVTLRASPPAPAVQYEVMETTVNLEGRRAGTPYALPLGWAPLQAERRSGKVVVLLYRQK